MNKKLFKSVIVTSAIVPLLSAQVAFACHPVGMITKSVQNETTNGSVQDANDSAHAVTAKTGDILRYTIVVSNAGTSDSSGLNDMANVQLSDSLPAGVELVSNPTDSQISENLGAIKAQASVTKTYEVKVTATKNGQLIENKACYSGNSADKNALSGCDVADVLISIPVVPTPTPTPNPTPTPPVVKTPVTPVVASQATVLPNTGPGNIALLAVGTSLIGFAGSMLFQTKRQ